MEINGGLRIRGGYSRNANNPKHSFRLFFRDEYEGDLFYPLFGSAGVDRFEKVDLRTSQNYDWGSWGHGCLASANPWPQRDDAGSGPALGHLGS